MIEKQSSKTVKILLLMASALILAFASFGCTGDQGDKGDQGEQGLAGEKGDDGVGADGADGDSCTVKDNGNGTKTISCEDGTSVNVDDGEQGLAGENGTSCTVTDNGDGSKTISCDDGTSANVVDGAGGHLAEVPMTAAQVAQFEADNSACLGCHGAEGAPGYVPMMIEDFKISAKAKAGVKCADCHLDNAAIALGEGHRFMPSAEVCGSCHPNQYAGHRANRHSIGFVRQMECGRFDDFPQEFQVGSGYHFDQGDVDQLSQLMNTSSQGTPADASVTSILKCGQCHNIENRCDSCHFRHRFSPGEARDPRACGTCHMGPDHPQIEMYDHSKHGTRFDVYGDTETVPVCVDCHMPYNTQMLGKKTVTDGNGNIVETYTDHNVAAGIAYGPVGGGTVRTGFITEGDTNRLKFKARDADATNTNLWMERADGKFYDSDNGGNAVFDDMWSMASADADSDGIQDYVVIQQAMSAAELETERAFMRDQVCGQCHIQNFADEHLLVADLIHENANNVLNEAFDIVRALALTGNLYLDDGRPANPETGTTGTYGANMKVRNLTAIEKMYFTAMKYEKVKTWKGAYHFNPDYTHWYGWSALVMTLGEIGDEATDNVLTSIWMSGKPYPGATSDVVIDQLYQGVIYENASMTNVYDKYPGDGVDPIDVDMDGTPEFIPTGTPGEYTLSSDANVVVKFH